MKNIILRYYRILEAEYEAFRRGIITKEEYRQRAGIIDAAIDRLESATLPDSPTDRKTSAKPSEQ